MDLITNISQLKDSFSNSMATIQEDISSSKIDPDIKILLDKIAQENCYALSAIIEYLENQK